MLPNYDSRPIQEIKLPVSKTTLKVKPYTVAQEQTILESMVDIENKTEFLINIKEVLKSNIQDDYDIEKMFLVDLVYLNMKLRAISKSETFEYSITCDNEECESFNKQQKHSNNIESLIFVKNSGEVKKIVKIDDKLTIEIQPAKLDFVDYLATKDSLEFENETETKVEKKLMKETLELAFVNIAYCIKKVIFENKIYDTFSIEELITNILSNLTETQIKTLQKEKNKLANIYLKIEGKCNSCGKAFEKVEDDFFVFLT